jgi:hypothetical protein
VLVHARPRHWRPGQYDWPVSNTPISSASPVVGSGRLNGTTQPKSTPFCWVCIWVESWTEYRAKYECVTCSRGPGQSGPWPHTTTPVPLQASTVGASLILPKILPTFSTSQLRAIFQFAPKLIRQWVRPAAFVCSTVCLKMSSSACATQAQGVVASLDRSRGVTGVKRREVSASLSEVVDSSLVLQETKRKVLRGVSSHASLDLRPVAFVDGQESADVGVLGGDVINSIAEPGRHVRSLPAPARKVKIDDDAIVAVEPNTPEWFDARARAIVTASQFAKWLGHGRFVSRYQAWVESKMTRKERNDAWEKKMKENPELKRRIDYGNDHENDAIEATFEAASRLIGTVYGRKSSFFMRNGVGATPDALLRSKISNTDYVIEVKCTMGAVYDSIPPEYLIQIAVQMYCVDVEQAFFTCWSAEFSRTWVVLSARPGAVGHWVEARMQNEIEWFRTTNDFPRRVSAKYPKPCLPPLTTRCLL